MPRHATRRATPRRPHHAARGCAGSRGHARARRLAGRDPRRTRAARGCGRLAAGAAGHPRREARGRRDVSRCGPWPAARPCTGRRRHPFRPLPASAGRDPDASLRHRAVGTPTASPAGAAPPHRRCGRRARIVGTNRERSGRPAGGRVAGPPDGGRLAGGRGGRRSGRRRHGVERPDRPGDRLRHLATMPGAGRPVGGGQRDARGPDGQPVDARSPPAAAGPPSRSRTGPSSA